jgi:hypothetical protein
MKSQRPVSGYLGYTYYVCFLFITCRSFPNFWRINSTKTEFVTLSNVHPDSTVPARQRQSKSYVVSFTSSFFGISSKTITMVTDYPPCRFFQNTGAVLGVFTTMAIFIVGLVTIIIVTVVRRRRRHSGGSGLNIPPVTSLYRARAMPINGVTPAYQSINSTLNGAFRKPSLDIIGGHAAPHQISPNPHSLCQIPPPAYSESMGSTSFPSC